MAKQIFTVIKTLLPLIGLGIFGYLIYSLGIDNILHEIQRIPPIIILVSLLLTLPRILIRNSAWMLIHKQQHIQVSYWRSLKIFLMGYFYGSFTPGYVGQLMRVPYLKEHTNEPYGKLFVNSFLETTIHLLSMYALMFIGAILIIRAIPEVFYVVLIWIFAVVIFLWVFVKKERGERILLYLGRTIVFRILFFIPTHWKTSSKLFVKTFYHDFPSVKSLLPPLLITSTTWIIIFSQEYLIAWSLNPDIPYLYFLVIFPLANMVGILPISFAGVGTRELASVALFTLALGLAADTVFAFTLVGFLITDVVTGFIGFLLTLTEAKPRALFETVHEQ